MSGEATARGFRIYAEFLDSHGQTIRIQESSGEGLWIFADNADGSSVNHWKAGGGWEPLPKPKPGPGLSTLEGWQSCSPHLDDDQCRLVIAALQEHLDGVSQDGAVRATDDHAGRRIDAADRILSTVRHELARLRKASPVRESVCGLLHGAIIAWADGEIEAGRLTETEPEYDTVSKCLAALDARAGAL